MSKRSGGGGKKLSYLEGWDVKQKANEIFGFGNWGYQVVDLVCLGDEPFTNSSGKEGVRVGYRATVEVWVRTDSALWGIVRYSDTGYGDAQEYNGSKITPHELASKEAVTDAMKRAFTSLGDQFGLCLYDKEAPEHDGIMRDPIATLKNRVSQVAIEGGAEPTAVGIAAYFGLDVQGLSALDEEGLYGLLAASS